MRRLLVIVGLAAGVWAVQAYRWRDRVRIADLASPRRREQDAAKATTRRRLAGLVGRWRGDR